MEPVQTQSVKAGPSYKVAWASDWSFYQKFASAAKGIFYQFMSEVIEGPGFEHHKQAPVHEEVYDILNMDVSGYHSSSDLEFVKTPEARHREPTLAVAEHTPEILEIDQNYMELPSLKPAEA